MNRKSNRLTAAELSRLRDIDFSKQPGFENADTKLSREVGAEGTPQRADFDAKARAWYYGEVLRERRKEIGLTQVELANRIGRDRTYIIRVERGETDLQLSSFIRLADALGISINLEMRRV